MSNPKILYFKVTYTDRALNEIVKTIPAAPWADILPLAFSAKYKEAEWKLRSIQAVWNDAYDPIRRDDRFEPSNFNIFDEVKNENDIRE